MIVESNVKVMEIPNELIFSDSELNCRGAIAPIDVMELANDIRDNGLLQPITVHPYTRGTYQYRIIMGHRRYAANKMAGNSTIKAIIKEAADERTIRYLNLSENVNRKDLNIVQEAKAVNKLVALGETQDDIAARLNQSRGWVQIRIALMELPDEIQKDAAAGLLRAVDIRDLARLKSHSMQMAKARELKDQLLLGKRKRKDVTKTENLKQPRSRQAIFDMQELIYDQFDGNNLATKALAWAAGEIDDLEMHTALKDATDGRYVVPPELTKTLIEEEGRSDGKEGQTDAQA